MKTNKITVGVAAFIAILATAGVVTYSFAYQGDPTKQGPNYSPERHEAMLKAIDSNNYDEWKKLHEEFAPGRGIASRITEENFAKFKEMHNLRLKGDVEGANKIRAELGLGQGRMKHGNGPGKQGRGGRGMHRGENLGGNFVDNNGDGICDNLNK